NVTVNGGETWSPQHNQPTAELYQVDVSDELPYRLYAGQQDNTTVSVPSLPPRRIPGGHTALWEAHGGCETGPVVPKPGEPDLVYANCKGRFGVYNRRTGHEQQYYVGFWNLYGHNPKDLAYRFQRVAPIHVSPHDPDRVYHASQFVHVTEDGGKTWEAVAPDLAAFTAETQVVSGTPITLDVTGEEHFSTLYDVQESPHEPGVIWVGANDGPIHITRDGGKSWKDVTPAGIGPYGRVQNIEVSPHRPARAYAAILRYQLGDFEPYAYKTEDYGESWTRMTTGENGIPRDTPVRVVREDPDREGLLYAGTEFGMFVSFDDGESWQSFQLNLPITPITDVKVVHRDLVLSTMGRGFWILDNLTPLHELGEQVVDSEAYLFEVRDPYRITGVGRPRGPAKPADPRFREIGADIDYYLAREPEGAVRLEILDREGCKIRELSSVEEASTPAAGPDGEGTRPGAEKARSGLAKTAGMHRFTWDLRYSGVQGPEPGKSSSPERSAPPQLYPAEGDGGYAGTVPEDRERKVREPTADDLMRNRESSGRENRGPTVPPGRYQARLVVGDWSETRTFEVKMDPRVLAEGITADDVRAQAELALQARDLITEARESFERVEQLLTRIRKQLVADPIRYSQPKLLDQLEYLYRNLDRSDQIPGRDAYRRLDELSRALEGPLGELEQILDASEAKMEESGLASPSEVSPGCSERSRQRYRHRSRTSMEMK
ncbi:MAG: hypothetical protein MI919_33350, partial [Holophagales bacterium]|nr:hypothetical protein [Holophagales bacterium]